MSNPRNQMSTAPVETTTTKSADPNSWKFLTIGSAAVKDGRNLVRANDVSFTINARNAEVIRDLAQHVLDSGDENERISISASPFYEDSVSEQMKKFFSHRLYVSAETVAKIGKKFSDYVKSKS